MQVVPVIDLMGGSVVRAVAGRRAEYRPLVSCLAEDSRPQAIAQALALVGFRRVYIADLDAIAGREPAWSAYHEIAAAGLAPWIDAGLSSVAAASSLLGFCNELPVETSLIAGLESLASVEQLDELCALMGPQRLIFGLDLQAGQPLTNIGAWRGATADEIAAAASAAGIERMILLDLSRVGRGEGLSTLDLCRRLHARFPQLELVGGGGIRGAADLVELATTGCRMALVGSALHDGRLTPHECHELART